MLVTLLWYAIVNNININCFYILYVPKNKILETDLLLKYS